MTKSIKPIAIFGTHHLDGIQKILKSSTQKGEIVKQTDDIIAKLKSNDLKAVKAAATELAQMEFIPSRYYGAVISAFYRHGEQLSLGGLKERVFDYAQKLKHRQEIYIYPSIKDSVWNLSGDMSDIWTGFSEELYSKWIEWQYEYDKNSQFWENEPKPSDEQNAHRERGLELAKRIKAQLKGEAKIWFYDHAYGAGVDFDSPEMIEIRYFCLDSGVLRDEFGAPLLFDKLCSEFGIPANNLERELYELSSIFFDNGCSKEAKKPSISELEWISASLADRIQNTLGRGAIVEWHISMPYWLKNNRRKVF